MVLQKSKILNKNFFPGKSFNTLVPEAIFDVYVAVNFLSQVILIFLLFQFY